MAWIMSHQELGRHPKTKRLSRALGISVPATIGHLHLLWWWALDYAQDGCLGSYYADEIADAAMWEGEPEVFVKALVAAGFVDDTDDGLIIHDWYDYGGKVLEKREHNAEKQREWRSRNGYVTVTSPSRSGARVDKSREEKSREDNTIMPQAATQPQPSPDVSLETPIPEPKPRAKPLPGPLQEALRLFSAKRFRTTGQREQHEQLLDAVGEAVYLKAVAWASTKMALGDVDKIRKAAERMARDVKRAPPGITAPVERDDEPDEPEETEDELWERLTARYAALEDSNLDTTSPGKTGSNGGDGTTKGGTRPPSPSCESSPLRCTPLAVNTS